MAVRAGFVVFMLAGNDVLNIDSRFAAIIQDAQDAISEFHGYAFGFFALPRTRSVRIFWIIRPASAACAAVFFAAHLSCVTRKVKNRPSTPVFL